jgi:hypothetical protein
MLEIFVETKIESCRCDILISQATNLNLDEPNNAPYLVGKELPRCLQIRMEYEGRRGQRAAPSLPSGTGDEGSNCSSAASVEKVGMLGWIGRGGVAGCHCLDARNLNLK